MFDVSSEFGYGFTETPLLFREEGEIVPRDELIYMVDSDRGELVASHGPDGWMLEKVA